MNESRIKKIDAIFDSDGPIVRASVLLENKFCSKDVAELVTDGYISKIKTGYYIRTPMMSELSELELVSLLIPQGVISLFSAAQYHNMTTVNPTAIIISLPKDMRTPTLPEHPPINIFKTIRRVYEVGIEEVQTQNCVIKVYDRERTVCDFFRMRLQYGEDIALEVLKYYMSGKKNLQKLYEYAEVLQIKSVIRPYVEALL